MENDIITHINSNYCECVIFEDEKYDKLFRKYFSGVITDDYIVSRIVKNTSREILIFDKERNHYLMMNKKQVYLNNQRSGFLALATSSGKSKDGRDYSTSFMYFKEKDRDIWEPYIRSKIFIEVIDKEKGIYLIKSDNCTLYNALDVYHYDKKAIEAYETLYGELSCVDYRDKHLLGDHPAYQELEKTGIKPDYSFNINDYSFNINTEKSEDRLEEFIDLAVLCREDSDEFIKRMDKEIKNNNPNYYEKLKSQIKDTVESNTKTKLLTLKTKIHK